MTELNPNHPVTRQMHDQWHKLCAVLMLKLGVRELEIVESDVDRLVAAIGDGGAVVIDTRGGRTVLRLVGPDDAAQLARKAGGLPS